MAVSFSLHCLPSRIHYLLVEVLVSAQATNTAPKEDWNSLAEMFNGTMYPRNYIEGNAMEYVHLFRSAAMPPSYLVDQNIPSTKNHFVTCYLVPTSLSPLAWRTIFQATPSNLINVGQKRSLMFLMRIHLVKWLSVLPAQKSGWLLQKEINHHRSLNYLLQVDWWWTVVTISKT